MLLFFIFGSCLDTALLFPFSEKFEGCTFLTGDNRSFRDPNNIPMLRNATWTAARTQHRKNWKGKGGRVSLSSSVVTTQLKIQNKYQHVQECLNTISEFVSPLTDLNLKKKTHLYLLLTIQYMYFSLDQTHFQVFSSQIVAYMSSLFFKINPLISPSLSSSRQNYCGYLLPPCATCRVDLASSL